MKKHLHCALLIPNTHKSEKSGFFLGGAEKQVVNILNQLKTREEIHTSLISHYTKFPVHYSNIDVYASKIDFHSLLLNSLFFIAESFIKLFQINRKKKIDVIYVHMLGFAPLPAILFNLFIRKPIIVKISGKISQVRGKKSSLSTVNYLLQRFILLYRKFLIRSIDKFQVLNSAMRKELISLYRVRPEQIYLVPNGISVEKITPKPPLTSVESFGFVGRLAKTKKIDVLLAGFKIFLQHQDNAKLLIYGVGPQEKLIEDFIKRNKLDEKIHLMGFEKNTPTIFSSFDVFLLTSEGEGISNSLLEAMAYGIPSIVSKVAGNVDVIHQNHSGLLFSPDSPSEMANCMLILSENLDFANKMSNNARKSLERNYNMRSIVSKLISIISESI